MVGDYTNTASSLKATIRQKLAIFLEVQCQGTGRELFIMVQRAIVGELHSWRQHRGGKGLIKSFQSQHWQLNVVFRLPMARNPGRLPHNVKWLFSESVF